MKSFECSGKGTLTHMAIIYSSQPCPLCECYDLIGRLRCALEASIDVAEAYSDLLTTTATVAENVGHIHRDALPKNARAALAKVASRVPERGDP